MSEDKVDVLKKSHHGAVDVFTHSRTGFPGAWSEDDVQILLDTWEDVLSRPRSRRFSVSKKIHKRLISRDELKDVNKDDVIQQMKTLRTEYSTYLGLQIVGLETVRPIYVDQLERIFSKTPKFLQQDRRRQRRNTEPTQQADRVSEDSDHSRSVSVTYGDGDKNKIRKEFNENTKNEEGNSNRRGRFQRMNIQRLIRTMLNQQNAMMDQVQKLFNSLEESNSKTATLLEDLVTLQKLKNCNVSEKSDIIAAMA